MACELAKDWRMFCSPGQWAPHCKPQASTRASLCLSGLNQGREIVRETHLRRCALSSSETAGSSSVTSASGGVCETSSPLPASSTTTL